MFISHDASQTGAPILLINLAEALMKERPEFSSSFLIKARPYDILPRFNHFSTILASKRVNLINRISFTSTKDMREYLFSKKNIKKALGCVDVVISNTITNGDILPLVRTYFKGPIVSYIHELEMAAKFFSNKKNIESLITCTDLFLVPSLAVQDFLVKEYGLSLNQIHFLSYYIPLKGEISQSDLDDKYSDDTFIVGGAGTLDWRKSPDLFIQVAACVFNKMPNSRIKFLWQGATLDHVSLYRLQYDIKKMNLESKIELLPSSNNMYDFYKKLKLFLLTSREDPYPLVVLEAANACVPTICFKNSGGAQEFIESSMGGKCIDYLNIEKMADAVIYYYNNQEQNLQAGKRSKLKLQQTHQNSEFVSHQFNALLNKIKIGK